MANKKITLKNKAGEKLYPSTIMEQVVGINEALDGKLGKTEKAASASSADVANAVIDGSISTSKIATAAITPAKIQTSIALNGTPSMTVEPTTSSPDKTIASVGLVKEVVDGIEIGGRNLIRNGDFLQGTEHWSLWYNTGTLSVVDKIATLSLNDTQTQGILQSSPISLESGQQYIVSLDIKSDSITTLNYCYLMSSAGNKRLPSINGITSEWHRLECKFTAAQTGVYNVGFGIQQSAAKSFSITNVKVEKGNKATGWTPAPEDINTEISNAETRSKSHAEDYTDAEITKIENGETVAQKANSLYDEDSGDWKIWKDVTNAVGDEVEEVLKQNNFATKDDIQSIIPSNATETGAGIVRAATQAEVNDGHVSDNDPSEMAFVRPETLQSKLDTSYPTIAVMTQAISESKEEVKGVVSAMDFPIEHVQGLKEALDGKLGKTEAVVSADRSKYIETLHQSNGTWYGDNYKAYIQWEDSNTAKLKIDGYFTKTDEAIDAINADKAKTLKTLSGTVQDLNNLSVDSSSVEYYGYLPGTSSNMPTHNAWQNSVMCFGLHSNGATAQMFFSKDKPLYYRSSHTGEWKQLRTIDDKVTTSHIADAAITPAKIQTSIALNGTPSMTVEPTTSSPDKTIASVGLVKEVMEDIEIGGRNLILNSDFTKGVSYWTPLHDYSTVIFNVEENIASFTLGVSDATVLQTSAIRFEVGQEYTVSFDCRSDEYTALDYCYFIGQEGQGNKSLSPFISGISSEWNRIVYTFTSAVNGLYRFGFGANRNRNTAGSFQLRNVKIEKGNKATDWSPSPEDSGGEIDTRNLLLNSKEKVITGSSGSTHKHFRFDLPISVKKGDVLTFNCDSVENISGDATEYTVLLVDILTDSMISYRNGVITADNRVISLLVTADSDNAGLALYAGKIGDASSVVKYTNLTLVKGNKPMLTWQAAPEDINTEISNAETRSKAHAEDYTNAEITKIENGETVAQKANSLYDEDSGDWKIWKDVTNAVGDEVEEVLKQNNFATKDDIQAIIPSNATETGAGIVRAATQAEVNDGHVSDNDPSEMAFVRPETLENYIDSKGFATTSDISDALASAKPAIFFQAAQPAGGKDGDIWIIP